MGIPGAGLCGLGWIEACGGFSTSPGLVCGGLVMLLCLGLGPSSCPWGAGGEEGDKDWRHGTNISL